MSDASTTLWNYGNLSSGDTTGIEREQLRFSQWMSEENEGGNGEPFPPHDHAVWNYDLDFGDDRDMQNRFFRFIGEKIRSIPPQRYILRYLLVRYQLLPGKEKLRGFMEYVRRGRWRISGTENPEDMLKKLQELLTREEEEKKSIPGTSADHNGLGELSAREDEGNARPFSFRENNLILSVLSALLRAEYPEKLKDSKGSWSTYFNRLIRNPDSARLRELALALNWDWGTYRTFRTKVLRCREKNFLDREEILMFLALNYAGVCGMENYPAYCRLKELYPAPAKGDAAALPDLSDSDGNASARIGNCLLELLEQDGSLSPQYRQMLFMERIEALAVLFDKIFLLNQSRVPRSTMKVLQEKWNELAERIYRQVFYEEKDTHSNRQNINRWLYGRIVEKKKMVRIAPETVKNFFLDSEEFEDTYLRDSIFYAKNFPTDEARQRNLLLTVLFLNYLYMDDYSSTYEERIAHFDFETADILADCGFMSLHSGYAYDAFLKFLLSCSDPLGLFQFIWKVKTGA